MFKIFYWKNDYVPTTYQSFILGVNILYALVLLEIPLRLIVFGGYFIILLGIILILSRKITVKHEIKNFYIIFLFALFLIPFIDKIIFEPLEGWDARSIWFFHGKMMFYEGLFDSNILKVNHFDYPKLLPALTAICSSFYGIWNEHIPKIALVIFLFGVFAAFWDIRSPSKLAKVTLCLTVLLFSPSFIPDGYVDAWLAIFSLLTNVFMINYIKSRDQENLISAIMTLMMLASLKNEGILLLFIILTDFILILLFLRNNILKDALNNLKYHYKPIVLSIVPIVIWTYYRYAWKLDNDLNVFSKGFFERVKMRFNWHDIAVIYNSMIRDTKADQLFIMAFIIAITLIIYFRTKYYNKNVLKESVAYFMLPFASALIYAAGMLMIYLGTPAELVWHLTTSAGRTVMPVMLLLLLTPYAVLNLKNKT